MTSLRKSENQSRIAAIDNARDAILERAEKDAARMMKGMLTHPELTRNLHNFEKILEILLNKGYKEELILLAQHSKVREVEKSKIRRAVGEDNFKNTETAVLVSPMSAARRRAEQEFARLCQA